MVAGTFCAPMTIPGLRCPRHPLRYYNAAGVGYPIQPEVQWHPTSHGGRRSLCDVGFRVTKVRMTNRNSADTTVVPRPRPPSWTGWDR